VPKTNHSRGVLSPPRAKIALVLTGVVLIAGVGWGVSTRLRSPADEAAQRKPPQPSLVTAPVERIKLKSTVVVSGTVEYGSPLPVSLAGVVGSAGGTDQSQRATRAPRVGRVKEGGVFMEVNGRPVFALGGGVPMHRSMAPGTKGDDVRQLQKALRRLGYGAPVTGVFDSTTVAAVTRLYQKKGYEAQKPSFEARQQLDNLSKAVRSARETLATERKSLDAAADVAPLKLKFDNAKTDLRAAQSALEQARSRSLTPEDEAKLESAAATVRGAEEKVYEARQALEQARATPTPTPTRDSQPSPTPTSTSPVDDAVPAPSSEPSQAPDLRLLQMRLANAQADLSAAQRALSRAHEEIGDSRAKRMEELRKGVRTAQEALLSAEQELRKARDVSSAKIKVANAKADLASAKAMVADYQRTFGTSIPPGELVFLPKLPARVNKVAVKPGETVDKAVATVTGSSFVVSGSVELTEADLLKTGKTATIEAESGKAFPARLIAIGDKAKLPGEEPSRQQGGGQPQDSGQQGATSTQPVLIAPTSQRSMKGLAGTAVTVRITVGATKDPVLVVPLAAVVTAADGKSRVLVEASPDRTKEVEVRTGLSADGKVAVSGDLKEGDRVVVNSAA
jgi:peptidoglycan hydrolase-like protein with peptidoglycan-binding domain